MYSFSRIKICNKKVPKKKDSKDKNKESAATVCKTKVPVLFIKVMCNKFVVEKLQLFTNLDLEILDNVFWPTATEMAHCGILFCIVYAIRPLQRFQVWVTN
jgi:hypothetical protein